MISSKIGKRTIIETSKYFERSDFLNDEEQSPIAQSVKEHVFLSAW